MLKNKFVFRKGIFMKIKNGFKAFAGIFMSAVMVVSFSAFSKNAFAEEMVYKTIPTASSRTDIIETNKPENNEKIDIKSEVSKLKKQNTDVVGWITIPGTTVNEPVVYSNNNTNYLRRNADGVWDYFGAYFTDMDNKSAKKGTREALNKHTIIYGHNVYWGIETPKVWLGHELPDLQTENLGADYKGGEKFAQLFNYTDAEFCKNHPYIYYTTDSEEMVFEVFAAYYTDLKFEFNSTKSVFYSDDMLKVANGSKAKSVFDFNVPVEKNDKIITLSTCSYIEGPRSEDIRFNVAAKLCAKNEVPKKEAKITKNMNKIGYRQNIK